MLKQLIQYYDNDNKTRFARRLGMTPQGISTWLSRGTMDSELIYSKCEGVSADWLLSGEGPMIRSDRQSLQDSSQQAISSLNSIDQTPIVKLFMDMIKEKDAKIDQLQKELREKSEELATLKAKFPENTIEQQKENQIIEDFTPDSYGDYGEGSLPTNQSSISKRLLAGKT